jgi:hypothetical protein
MVDQDNKDPGEVLAGATQAPAPETPASPVVEGVEPLTTEAPAPEPKASDVPPAPEPEGDGVASSLSAAAVGALLDAAETANEVAQAAERVGQSFHGGMTELNTHLGGIQKLNKTIVYAMGGILFLGLLVFVYMATTLTVRLSRLDATLEAVGTRVVKQAAGLRELESIREAMGVVAETQRDLLMAQDRLTTALQDTQQQLESLPSTVPSALEPRIDSALAGGMEALNGRVDALSNVLGAQEGVLKSTTEALENMGKRLQAVDGRTRSLLRLESDVEALVTLSRERYLEVLEAQLEIGDTGPRLRYPPANVRLGEAPPENRGLTDSPDGGSGQ